MNLSMEFYFISLSKSMWVRDAYSTGHYPSFDTDNGGTEDIELTGFSRSGTTDI